MKKLLLLLLVLTTSLGVYAQTNNPAAKIKQSHSSMDKGVVTLSFEVTLDKGFHIYGTDLPEDGPTPTQLVLEGSKGVKLVGSLEANKPATKVHDPSFDMDLTWYEGVVTFSQKVQIKDPNDFVLSGYMLYMLCNDKTCIAPRRESFKITPATLREEEKKVATSVVH